MKKMILVVGLTMSMLLQVNAQSNNDTSSKLKFGVKAGVNLANASGNGINFLFGRDESSENRLGLTIGGLVEYQLSEKISLQGELAYAQQGFKKNYSDDDYKETFALNYLNVPVMAKYYIADELSFEVGSQFGFLLAAKYNENDDGDKYEEDVKEFFKSTDFGIIFGLGYQLENGLGLNLRYNLGLSNIFDFSRRISENVARKATENNNYELKNRVFNLSVLYTF